MAKKEENKKNPEKKRESDLEDIEERVEEVEEEEGLQDFSQFISGGEIVEIAPGVSHVLASGERHVTNLEQEFTPVETGEKKEEKEEIKYAAAEQIYKQAGEMRAYEEAKELQREAGGERVFKRGMQAGFDVERVKNVSPRVDTNVRPIDIPEMWGRRAQEVEGARSRSYLSSSEIEKERDVSKIEKRKYEVGV